MVDRLEQEHEQLKAEIEDMEDRSREHVHESKSQAKEVEQLRRSHEQKVAALREKQAELERVRREVNSKENEGANLGQEAARLEASNYRKGSSHSGLSWASQNEKQHTIKVL